MTSNNAEGIATSKHASPQEEGTLDTIRTRQGVSGQGVRYVLAASLIGIVIAFILVLAFAR